MCWGDSGGRGPRELGGPARLASELSAARGAASSPQSSPSSCAASSSSSSPGAAEGRERLAALLCRCLAEGLPDALRRAAAEGPGAGEAGEAARLLADEVCAAAACLGSQAGQAGGARARLASRAREALGTTVLCLSGGGMLGTYHLGVLKRLVEMGALPDHLCCTSVGSMFGAFAATHTDAELRSELCSLRGLFSNLGPELDPFPLPYWAATWRWIRRGYMYDYSRHYDIHAALVSRGLTFAEAFARTGRSLTITCVPTGGGPVLLLNRHTAPHVLIRSAICASCSMPFLIEAIQLIERAPDGKLRPWAAVSPSARFRDGTLGQEVPRRRLEQQFNLRWAIVSQLNPHVVPLEWPRRFARRVAEGHFRKTGQALLAAEAGCRKVCGALWRRVEAAWPRKGGWLHAILFQDYVAGDVNILHTEMRLVDYYRCLKSERTMEEFQGKVEAARLETQRFALPLQLWARVERAVRDAFPEAPLAGRGVHPPAVQRSKVRGKRARTLRQRKGAEEPAQERARPGKRRPLAERARRGGAGEGAVKRSKARAAEDALLGG